MRHEIEIVKSEDPKKRPSIAGRLERATGMLAGKLACGFANRACFS